MQMVNISFHLPENALKLINQWANASGIPHAKYYSEALILGARIMAISAPPEDLADLPSENFKYLSESANKNVTPSSMLQIITGAKSRTLLDDSEGSLTELVVSLPDDLFKRFSEHADSIGMQHEKYFSLALAMGARLNSMNNPWKG